MTHTDTQRVHHHRVLGSDEDDDVDDSDDGKGADYDAAADFEEEEEEEDDEGGGDEFYREHTSAGLPTFTVDINCWTHSIHLVFGDVAKSHPTINAGVETLKRTVT